MDVEIVSRAFLDAMFDSLETEDYEPRGMFLCEDEVDGRAVWVAVDNRNGDALTEEFNFKYAAMKWLRGQPTLNRWGELLNKEGAE